MGGPGSGRRKGSGGKSYNKKSGMAAVEHSKMGALAHQNLSKAHPGKTIGKVYITKGRKTGYLVDGKFVAMKSL
jgi:hypothetical protein